MELVKRNADTRRLGKLFSLSSAFGYAEGVALSLGMGCVLDHDPGMWKILFFATALVGMGVLVIQARIPVDEERASKERERLNWKELLVRPWKDSYRLIRERPDFAKYQWGFMVCGFGIMLIQPALPIFAVDDLGVSYTMAAGGVSIAKGLGFSLSSLLWARWIQRIDVLRLASWVFLSVALFPVLMACSLWWVGWFYLAYFWYGVGQGGSHLVWHMSGPIFAGKEESSRYSGVGLMMVGLRGAVAPPLGGWLTVGLGPVAVLLCGGLLSFFSGAWLFRKRPADLQTERAL
jgi:MFS family permease